MRNYRRLSAGLLCTVFITRVRRIARRESERGPGREKEKDEGKRGRKREERRTGVRSRLAVAKERTSDREGAGGRLRRRGFKSRDVLVHSCESTSCGGGGGGAKGGPEERACVGSRAAARSNGHAPSLSLRHPAPAFSLFPSVRFSPPPPSHHRRRRRGFFSFPFSVAPELSGKHATSFSLLLASARSLLLLRLLSFLLDDNVEPGTGSLSVRSRPLLSALFSRPTRRSCRPPHRRRDSIIIVDSLISINC